VQTPLNASASTAGALLSSSTFEVPQFQREYSWERDQVEEFWTDLRNSLESVSYFMGLIILTDEGGRKHVVDGQQRLITLSLLATAIHFEATKRGRKALADRIQADFLRSIDYDSDETHPRIVLSDLTDNATYQDILSSGKLPSIVRKGSVAEHIVESFRLLTGKLQEDLKVDPFKRLGKWTEFLTHRLYFAVFVHPDPASAYQVYEVINTRGKDLTTADLLKNYILSQTKRDSRQARYEDWQKLSGQLPADTFVQFIRHVVTIRAGHILPKDLFAFLAQRIDTSRQPPTPDELMSLLQEHMPLYLQMVDPTVAGPADPEALKVFSALKSLGVIAVRPILLAIAGLPDARAGMNYVLRLVVRRIVVGNLGTGNIERRLGEAARKVQDSRDWKVLVSELQDLNPPSEQFVEQLRKRSFNKDVLAFLRRSILQETTTPDRTGVLHLIWTRQAGVWRTMSEEDGAFWGSTLGNTFLSELERRPKAADDWPGFKQHMLQHAVPGEWQTELESIDEWDAGAVEELGSELAKVAGEVWYGP
jgi:Protein of unknown function DUF262